MSQYAFYKHLRDQEKLPPLSFVEEFTKNKLLNDRLMMIYSSLEPTDIYDVDTYLNSDYYIITSNIYTIANALHNKNKSFILPLPMLRRLISIKKLFANDTEALSFVEQYEAKI